MADDYSFPRWLWPVLIVAVAGAAGLTFWLTRADEKPAVAATTDGPTTRAETRPVPSRPAAVVAVAKPGTRPASRPATVPASAPASAVATRPATGPAIRVQDLLAEIPDPVLFPDDSGWFGGKNQITQQRLTEWVGKRFVGRRVLVPVAFGFNGPIRDGQISVHYTYGFFPFVGMSRMTSVIQSRGGGQGLRTQWVDTPAAAADAILKLKAGDTIHIAGTVDSFEFRVGTIEVAVRDAALLLP